MCILAVSKPLNPVTVNLFVIQPILFRLPPPFPLFFSTLPKSMVNFWSVSHLTSQQHWTQWTTPFLSKAFVASELPPSSCFPLTSLAAPSPPPFRDFSPPPDSTCVRILQHTVLLTLFPLWTHLTPVGLNIIYILKASLFFLSLPTSSLSSRTVCLVVYFGFTQRGECLHGQTGFFILFPNILSHQ